MLGWGAHTPGPAWSMRPSTLPPRLPHSYSPLPLYLQPRHSRGAWWSRNTRGTLRDRRNNQTLKQALPHGWGQRCEGGQAVGRWRTSGETQETSDTHLRARLPGAAHPKSRSTLGGSGGSQKKGRGYRQRPHQAQGCMGRQLAGHKTLQGPCVLDHGWKPGLSPRAGGEDPQHHSPAFQRRWGLLGRGRSTPLAHPEKTRAFVRGGPGN